MGLEVRLELQPEGKHDLSLRGCTVKSRIDNRSCDANRTIDARNRIVQVDLIKEIEDVSAELTGEILLNWEILNDGKIGLKEAGPEQ